MTQYLLDTHALIWFLNEKEALSKEAKKIIEPVDTICYISIASLWEIAIKSALNKLELKTSFNEIEKRLSDNDVQILPITFKDLLSLQSLPLHHKDPFDRIIISQATNNNLTIITRDENFSLYGIKTLW